MNVIGINSTNTLGAITNTNTSSSTNNNQQVSFSQLLNEELNSVNSKQIEADNVTQNFINGDETDIHNVMISMEEAKMSLQLAVQVRNKLLDAYQEISRLQL